jgi:hypothetical protein
LDKKLYQYHPGKQIKQKKVQTDLSKRGGSRDRNIVGGEVLLQKYPDGAVDEKRKDCGDLANDDCLSVTI